MTNRFEKFSYKFDLETYLNKKNVEYILASDEQEIVLEVCLCCRGINKAGSFRPYKMYVNLDNKLFHCFLCGERGNLIKLMSIVENKSPKEIISNYVYNNKDYVILPNILDAHSITEGNDPSTSSGDQLLPPVDLPPSYQDLSPFKFKLVEAYEYLDERGFLDKEVIKKLGIGYSLHMKRIIFPIHQYEIIVGWQGRDITGNQEPKYLISKNLKKNLLLYNYRNIKNTQRLIIVEGIIDLVKCPIDETTCLFGKTLSEHQFNMILEMTNLKEIIIAIDPEEEESQEKLYKQLSPYFTVKLCILPKGTDPGDQTREDMVKYIEGSSNSMKSFKNKIL